MTSPLDKLHFGPTRTETERPDGTWLITIDPHHSMGLPVQCMILSSDQIQRYRRWRRGELLIQDAFPDLSGSQREVLMSGISQEDWDRIFKDD